MKKLELKKILYGGLAVSLAVGVGLGVHLRMRNPNNLIDDNNETASVTRRFIPVSANDVTLSVSGENLPEGVNISAVDMDYKFIQSSQSEANLSSGDAALDYNNALAGVLKEKDIAFAYDIELGHVLKSGESVEVTIDDLKINNPETFMVLHIKDDGEREFIKPTYVDKTKVKFIATSFSFYAGYDATPMVFEINVPENTNLILPIKGTGIDAVIDWGENDLVSVVAEEKPQHNYENAGTYRIQIAGNVPEFGNFNSQEDGCNLDEYITKIYALGDLDAIRYGFYGYNITNFSAGINSNTSAVADMSFMFKSCTLLESADLSGMEVANVNNVSNMFDSCVALKEIVVDSSWNLKNGIQSANMFKNACAIVGAFGFSYDDQKTDATYAIVNDYEKQGYFTDKNSYKVEFENSEIVYCKSLEEVMNIRIGHVSEKIVVTMMSDRCEYSNVKLNEIDFDCNSRVLHLKDSIEITGTIITGSNGLIILDASNGLVLDAAKLTIKNSRIESLLGDAITLKGQSELVIEDSIITAKNAVIKGEDSWQSGLVKMINGTYESLESDAINVSNTTQSEIYVEGNSKIIGATSAVKGAPITIFKGGELVGRQRISKEQLKEIITPEDSSLVNGLVSMYSENFWRLYFGQEKYGYANNSFDSLTAIMNMQLEDNAVITVLNNFEDNNEYKVSKNVEVILNLNGHEIYRDKPINVYGSLVLMGAGIINASSDAVINNNGNFVIKDDVILVGENNAVTSDKPFRFEGGILKARNEVYEIKDGLEAIVPEGLGIDRYQEGKYKVAELKNYDYIKTNSNYLYNGEEYDTLKQILDKADSENVKNIYVETMNSKIVDDSVIEIPQGGELTLETSKSQSIVFVKAVKVNGTWNINGSATINENESGYAINNSGNGEITLGGVKIVASKSGIATSGDILFNAGSIKSQSTPILMNENNVVEIPETMIKKEYSSSIYNYLEVVSGKYMNGLKSYETLGEAVEDAETGNTIRFIEACVDSSVVVIDVNKELLFDIGEVETEFENEIIVNGTLEVIGNGILRGTDELGLFTNNGTLVLNIKEASNNSGNLIVSNERTNLTLLDGQYFAKNYVVVASGESKVTLGASGDRYASLKPMLTSENVAVKTDNGFEFYDGSIRGKSSSYEGTISEVEKSHKVVDTMAAGYNVTELQKTTDDLIIVIEDSVYTGAKIVPNIKVYDGTTYEELYETVDYTYQIKPSSGWYINYNVGSYEVTITGAGNYSGTKKTTWNITKKEIDFKWIGPYVYEYDGKAHVPDYYCDTGIAGQTAVIDLGENINVGTYTATPVLKSITGTNGNINNYTYDFESTEYEIVKRNSEINVAENILNMYRGTSKKVGYRTDNINLDDTIKIECDNPDIIEIIKHENKEIEIHAKAEGTATITLKLEGNENETGSVDVIAVKVTEIAYTDGINYYETLSQAFNECADGAKITMLKDDFSKETASVQEGKTITLNLNGRTLTNEYLSNAIINNGKLTILNENPQAGDCPEDMILYEIIEQAKIENTAKMATIKNTGNLIINDNVWILGNCEEISAIENNGVCTLNNAKISNITDAAIQNKSGAKLYINNSEIISEQTAINNEGILDVKGTRETTILQAKVAIQDISSEGLGIDGATIKGKIHIESEIKTTINNIEIEADEGFYITKGEIVVLNSKINSAKAIILNGLTVKLLLSGVDVETSDISIDLTDANLELVGCNITSKSDAIYGINSNFICADSYVNASGDAVNMQNSDVNINNSKIKSTGKNTALVFANGTTVVSNSEITSNGTSTIDNQSNMSLILSNVISEETGGTTIENKKEITLKDTTVNSKSIFLDNDEKAILIGETIINATNGVINNGELYIGEEDDVVKNSPKIIAVDKAIQNNASIYWYDGELNGKSGNAYNGTSAILPSNVTSITETSGQTEKIYLVRDDGNPTINKLTITNDWTVENATIIVEANDDVRIDAYGITDTVIEPEEWQSESVITVSENGVYYIWVKDSVGNVAYQEIEITNICKAMWLTTDTTGDETRAVLTSTGELIFYVVDRKTGVNSSAKGSIKDYIFGDAPWITYYDEISVIRIEEGIEKIGAYALSSLENVNEIILASTIVNVDVAAFAKTNNYKTITSKTAILNIENGIIFDRTKTIIYAYGRRAINVEYILPTTVMTISPYAFYKNQTIENLTITKQITTVGEGAFDEVLGTIYYYTSCNAMKEYIKNNAGEEVYIPIDDTKPTITKFEIIKEADAVRDVNVKFAIKATDDTKPTKMLITENAYSESTITNVIEDWIDYEEEGVFVLSEKKNEIKTVYAWVKDDNNNISSCAVDRVLYDSVDIILKGNVNTVIYQDLSGKDYFAYNESVQGGYEKTLPYEVIVSGRVDHTTVGTYEIIYRMYDNGNKLDEVIRTVDVIPNEWQNNFYEENGYDFVLDSTGKYAKIDYYNGITSAEMTIPETITIKDNTVTVIDIGANIFANASIFDSKVTKITLPNSIINISDNAFRNCTSLSEFNIPNAVMSIGDGAFENIGTYSNSNIELNISDNVRVIGEGAFLNVNLTSINLGELLTCIKDKAFYNQNNETEIDVSISKNVQEIGSNVWSGLKINSIEVDFSNIYYKLSNDGKTIVTTTGDKIILYKNSLEDTTFVVPEGVSEIVGGAFANAKFLANIKLSNVRIIGEAAFEFSGLKFINVPESVVQIDERAFADLENLESMIVLGLPKMGNYVVTNIIKAGVIFANPNGVVPIENANSIGSEMNVYVPKALLDSYKSATGYATMINKNERLKPILKLNGNEEQQWVAGAPYIEMGAFAFGEFFDEDVNGIVFPNIKYTIKSNVNVADWGNNPVEYSVVYTGDELFGEFVIDSIVRNVNVSDFSSPVINKVETTTEWNKEYQEFVVYASDNYLVSAYKIKSNSTKPSPYETGWQASPTLKVTQSKVWYIFAKDTNGNVSEPYEVEADRICKKIWDVGEEEGKVQVQAVIPAITPSKLLITGNGVTKDFKETEVPWYGDVDIKNITEIIIDEGVTKLGEYLLSNIETCTSINISETVEKIGGTTFYNTNGFTSIIESSPNFSTDEGGYTLYDETRRVLYVHSKNDTSVFVLPKTVEEICAGAFMNNSITIIDIGNVKRIQDKAFYGAELIENIYVSEDLESIGENVFYGINKGPVYYYSSSSLMMNYVKNFGGEANFKLIDNVSPVIYNVVINNDSIGTLSRDVTLTINLYDDVGVSEILIEEALSSRVESGDSRWQPYDNSGQHLYKLSEGAGEKIVYVWVKDAAGNVSEMYTMDSIILGIEEFIIKGQENIVVYKDTTTDKYFAYDEEVQGGYELTKEGCTVNITNKVDTSVLGVQRIEYEYLYNGEKVSEHYRSVDVIENAWDTTVVVSGHFEYVKHKTEKYAKVIGYTGIEETVEIPGAFDDNGVQYKVIDIGSMEGNIFDNNNVSNVILPNTLINIGENTFKNLKSLTNIDIPLSVMSIGKSAFEDSGLTKVKLSDNMRVIEANAFANANVKDVVFGKLLMKIEKYAFLNATAIPKLRIRENIKLIQEAAFAGANITEILGETKDGKYTAISGEYLIYNVDSRKIIIAVNNSKLTGEVSIENVGAYAIGEEVFLNATNMTKLHAGNIVEIGKGAFRNSGLVTFAAQASVTKISESAFANCDSLTSFVIVGSPELSFNVFGGSTNVKKLVLVEGSKEIVISDNTKLPDTTTVYALNYDDYRSDLVWSEYAERIMPLFELSGERKIEILPDSQYEDPGVLITNNLYTENSIIDDISVLSLKVENDVDSTVMKHYEVLYKLYVEDVEVATLVRNVDIKDFEAPVITKIATKDMPQVGQEEFKVYAKDNDAVDRYAITKTEQVPDMDSTEWVNTSVLYATENGHWYIWVRDISNNYTYQEVEATHICKAYWDIGVEEETVYALMRNDNELIITGSGAVRDFSSEPLPWIEIISSISSLVIEDGVTSAGEYAFSELYNINSITIGKDFETVADTTFKGSNYFDTITVSAENTAFLGENKTLYSKDKTILYMHSNREGTSNVTLPNETKVIKSYAFLNNVTMTSLTLNDGTEIGAYAFYNAQNLSTINGTVGGKSIGAYAFAECGKLADVEISNSVERICSYAFSQCISLTKLDIAGLTNLKTLEHHALANMTSVSELEVPKSVKEFTSDEYGEQKVFNLLGGNTGQLGKVYYYDSCLEIVKYVYQSRDFSVEFVEIDTMGPSLISIGITNPLNEEVPAGAVITIDAIFSEECDFNMAGAPTLKFRFGDGPSKTPSVIVEGGKVRYKYIVTPDDYGELIVEEFSGTVYDMYGKATVFDGAEFSDRKIVARSGVKVTDKNETRYFTRLDEAFLIVQGTLEIVMLLDDEVKYPITINSDEEYTFDMNEKNITFKTIVENTLITNAGKLILDGDGSLSIDGATKTFGIMNTGELTIDGPTLNIVNNSDGVAYGIYNFSNASLKMINGEIKVSTSKKDVNTYGIYNEGEAEIDDGLVSAISYNGSSYGIYNRKKVSITGGNIIAKLYQETSAGNACGIYNAKESVVIGECNDVIDNTKPYIFGTNIGVKNEGTSLAMYDGIVEGRQYNSIISKDITTIEEYSIVKTLIDSREQATLGIDTKEPKIKIEKTPESSWSKDFVNIILNVSDEGTGVKEVLFEGEEIELINGVASLNVEENGVYQVSATDNANNTASQFVEISNIDKIQPLIISVENKGANKNGEVVLEVISKDYESGIYGVGFNTKNEAPEKWETISNTRSEVAKQIKLVSNGSYYIFVRDIAGNVTKYSEKIVVSQVDSAKPEIESMTILSTYKGYVPSSMVVLNVEAKDDVGVKEILLSNEKLSISEVTNSESWVKYTKEILWRIPNKDGKHKIYAWVRDEIGKISNEAYVEAELLSRYIGGNGKNETSLKILYTDNNYNKKPENELKVADIKVTVINSQGDITYESEYGEGIELEGEPQIYGPVMEGKEVIEGRYYTIIAKNVQGEGTINLTIRTDIEIDKAGNKVSESSEIRLPTDVIVELNPPSYKIENDEIIVEDREGNGTGYIKIDGITVPLTSGKISLADLENKYGIILEDETVIEVSDRCGNK